MLGALDAENVIMAHASLYIVHSPIKNIIQKLLKKRIKF